MAESARDFQTFKDYQTALRSRLSNKQLEEFRNLSSNEEKIIFVNALPNLMFPIKKEINRGKNFENAEKLKEKGNVCFQKGKYNEARWFYSQSILKSPQNSGSSDEIAIYHANRSAALYHLKEYNLAMKDIDFASSRNYPKHLLYKLLDRKARCLLALEKYRQACDIFKKTIQALDDAKLAIDKRQKWQKDIQIMLLMMSNNKQDRDNEKTTNLSKYDTNKIDGKVNPIYEAITSAIEIKHSDSMGRFAEAKQDIRAGKVILVEDPHCAVLLQKYQYTNCYHCFRRVKALFACPSCDQVVFCSENCAKAAMTYHEIECPILTTIWESGISVTCHISLRILAQKKLEYFLNRKQDLQKNEHAKGIGKYKSSDYKTILNLVSHEEKRKSEDIVNRVHMALFLLKCLKAGGYFGERDEITKNESLSVDEIFMTKLLLHHLQISQFNSHEVSELQMEKNDNLLTSSSEFIGGAIYPTLALLNHSCNPGVIRYFNGTKVITRAIRNIKAGEMVAENYGPIFTEIEKKRRQHILKEQYWFDCTCEACSNDWPTISKMLDEETVRFRCTNKECRSVVIVNPNSDGFMVKCRKCSLNNNIAKGLKSLQETDEKFKMAQTLLQLKKIDKVLDIALPILHLLEEILVPPFKDYYLCAQMIRTCFLEKGNVYLKCS